MDQIVAPRAPKIVRRGEAYRRTPHQAEIDDDGQAYDIASRQGPLIPALKRRDNSGKARERDADLDAYQ